MTKIGPERAALIERIKIAAAALEIPQEAVDHVVKHGTSYHRSKACKVLCEFALKYGVSLDWLIAGDIAALLKYAAIGYKITMPKAASNWAKLTSRAASPRQIGGGFLLSVHNLRLSNHNLATF